MCVFDGEPTSQMSLHESVKQLKPDTRPAVDRCVTIHLINTDRWSSCNEKQMPWQRGYVLCLFGSVIVRWALSVYIWDGKNRPLLCVQNRLWNSIMFDFLQLASSRVFLPPHYRTQHRQNRIHCDSLQLNMTRKDLMQLTIMTKSYCVSSALGRVHPGQLVAKMTWNKPICSTH